MATSPATAGERHLSIDAVRGFAVLGILLMNIVGMGLPSFAYINPAYAGGHEGADLWTWAANNVFTDGKMRALFTMLFGASAVLIAERAERGPPGPARTHYRRMAWLLVFGLLHAVFFWYGDILVTYAIAGLVIFPFRNVRPRTQIAVGVAVLVLLLAKNVFQSEMLEALRAAATAPDAPADAVRSWREASAMIEAPPEARDLEIARFGGDFVSAIQGRLEMLKLFYLFFLPFDAIPEAIGQMFVGMGLFRLGFFTLGWSTRAYAYVIAFGYLVAAPATAVGTWIAWRGGFEALLVHEVLVWQQTTRPFIALAHGGVILLLVRAGWLHAVVNRLAAAGRMAFSNYLMSSILTSLVFCGYGLGLFGELSRAELMWVVLAVWAFILAWSAPWLQRFHYGPFEWAWRSLVQWRPQRFVKTGGKTAPAAI